MTEGYGNGPELPARDTVFVHVAPGDEGISCRSTEHAIGGVNSTPHLVGYTTSPGAGIRGVNESAQAVITKPRIDSHRSMLHDCPGAGAFDPLIGAES